MKPTKEMIEALSIELDKRCVILGKGDAEAVLQAALSAMWQPIENLEDPHCIHMRGLWVHVKGQGDASRLEWQCYRGFIDEESGQFMDLDGNFIEDWAPEDYTHFLILPTPPEAT